MLNYILDIIFGIVLLLACALLVTYWMEMSKPMHILEKHKGTLVFKFRLGVYRGTVVLIRSTSITTPVATRHVTGWSCYFPPSYTDKEMCQGVHALAQAHAGEGSHSKDLFIFDEFINKGNTDLECVLGGICKKK